MYQDRQGRDIGVLKWADFWSDMDYRVVAETSVGTALVRTVWEGMTGPVGFMFATGVSADGETRWRTRGSADTEEEAEARHREIVAELERRG